MDHVSLGARELSGTRATASASSFMAARKTRLRIALSKPLLLIRCFIPTGTSQRGAEGSCPLWFTQSNVGECQLPAMKMVIPGGTGQVGRIFCRAFTFVGDEGVVFTCKAIPGCS